MAVLNVYGKELGVALSELACLQDESESAVHSQVCGLCGKKLEARSLEDGQGYVTHLAWLCTDDSHWPSQAWLDILDA